MNLNISVLILTFNEEINIADCIKSVPWCNDIVILDSYSQDKTCEIAKSLGVKVIQNKFEGYAKQRNFGLKKIEFKNPWVLMLDADERCTDELYQELLNHPDIKEPTTECALMYFRRKDHFLDKWIKRSSGYPTWFGRLVKPDYVEVKREINEEYTTEYEKTNLDAHIEHFPFNKGYSYWLERHNKYSTMEAEVLFQGVRDKLPYKALLSKDPGVRRKKLKQIVYSLPFRPLIIFLILYIFRGGFLEGKAGFVFCILRATYEMMIDLKVLELKRRKQNLTI